MLSSGKVMANDLSYVPLVLRGMMDRERFPAIWNFLQYIDEKDDKINKTENLQGQTFAKSPFWKI